MSHYFLATYGTGTPLLMGRPFQSRHLIGLDTQILTGLKTCSVKPMTSDPECFVPKALKGRNSCALFCKIVDKDADSDCLNFFSFLFICHSSNKIVVRL